MLDGDGFDALLAELIEQFGDAGLDVIYNLIAAFLLAKR